MSQSVTAAGKYMRISPTKVRKITGDIKGRPAEQALAALRFMPQKAAGVLSKILNSAVANAENNYDMNTDDLYVKNIIVDQGPVMKRFRARARGRGSRILKRSSHITVILEAKS